jgi:hypothetical protein
MVMAQMIFQVPLPVERLGGVANVPVDQPGGRVAMRDNPERLNSAQRVPALARASEPVRGEPVNPLA